MRLALQVPRVPEHCTMKLTGHHPGHPLLVARLTDLLLIAPVTLTLVLLPDKVVHRVRALPGLQAVQGRRLLALRLLSVLSVKALMVVAALSLFLEKASTPLAVVLRLLLVWYLA